jgi:hypothetical protein
MYDEVYGVVGEEGLSKMFRNLWHKINLITS